MIFELQIDLKSTFYFFVCLRMFPHLSSKKVTKFHEHFKRPTIQGHPLCWSFKFSVLNKPRSSVTIKSARNILSLSPGATQPIVGVYFTARYRALASSRTRLLDHTQRRATVGRTPLNE